MENVMENVEVVKMNVMTSLTVREVMRLHVALDSIMGTTPNMNGKLVYAFSKNRSKCESELKHINKSREGIILRYAELDNNGKPKLSMPTQEEMMAGQKPEYIYTDDNKIKAEEELNDLLDSLVSLNFHRIPLIEFATITLNPSKITGLDLITQYIIDDNEN